MLVAHVVEHLLPDEARAGSSAGTTPARPAGRVVMITPQERGYASDSTHVTFTDLAALDVLARDLDLVPERSYSFPFPRFVGRVFTYNEFVHVSRTPA